MRFIDPRSLHISLVSFLQNFLSKNGEESKTRKETRGRKEDMFILIRSMDGFHYDKNYDYVSEVTFSNPNETKEKGRERERNKISIRYHYNR